MKLTIGGTARNGAARGSDMDGQVFSTACWPFRYRLVATWDAMAAGDMAARSVGSLLYGDTFRDRQVLELGSGLGFDGLRFAAGGAAWTFADIVPDNLAVIRRIASLKGLEPRVHFHLIGDDLSFAGLPEDYDVIWVFGSIHHVPFEIARREAVDALGHLKPGGRWMELVYPRERWLREGALPFEQWGKLTDGERTPWAEWHDVEKVRRRLFPAPLRTVLDFEFCAQNYRWFDLRYAADRPFRLADFDLNALRASCDLLEQPIVRGQDVPAWRGSSFICPAGLFARAASIDLAAPVQRLGAVPGVAVDLEVGVSRGSVGIGLTDGSGAYLPAAEAVIDAAPDTRLVTLRAVDTAQPARLVFRNLRAGVRSAFTLRSAVLRPAT
jgi:hypothetical protein